MAHFAEIDGNSTVIRVVVLADKDSQDEDGNEVEAIGANYLSNFFGGTWKKTSYNTIGSNHRLQGIPFRKNYAGKGFTYDETKDAFIPPQPFPSWVLNEDTCLWDAPVAMPDDGNMYQWNEETQSWDQIADSE